MLKKIQDEKFIFLNKKQEDECKIFIRNNSSELTQKEKIEIHKALKLG